jgi:hypothetical protein
MVTVAIPTRYDSRRILSLISSVLRDDCVEKVLVLDNGHEVPITSTDLRVEVIDCKGLNIYQMWNVAFKACPSQHLALINDDVLLSDDTFFHLSHALFMNSAFWVTCPDWHMSAGDSEYLKLEEVKGTYKDDGISGFAFMLDVQRFDAEPFDGKYGWWFGDDDFVRSVSDKGGKLGRLTGLGITHELSGTSQHFPEVLESIGADSRRFDAKWSVR